MASRAASAAAQHRHPIQVVSRRTGLSADVIRAWEKRYAVVVPLRTGTRRRLYSDADVDRLRLLTRATLTGRTIGQVAFLTPAALAALVRSDGAPAALADGAGPAARAAVGAAVSTPERSTATLPQLAEALDAVVRFDVAALDVSLRRAALVLSGESFVDGLVVPFWDAVLDGVRGGTLRAAHEYVALSALRRSLAWVVEAATSPLSPVELVVATPSGQPHDLGALVTAAVAATEGRRAVFVGAGLPAETIGEAAVRLGARGVALSLGLAAGDRVMPRELRRLRDVLPAGVTILVEGAAADARRAVLREIDAVVVRDARALRARLREWDGVRRAPSAAVRRSEPVGRPVRVALGAGRPARP
jgi:hypothetical protein